MLPFRPGVPVQIITIVTFAGPWVSTHLLPLVLDAPKPIEGLPKERRFPVKHNALKPHFDGTLSGIEKQSCGSERSERGIQELRLSVVFADDAGSVSMHAIDPPGMRLLPKV